MVKRVFFILSLLALFSIAADAQIWVNGVEAFTKMTKVQVIAKFGEPIRYRYYDSQDNGVDERYFYDGTMLHFNDESFNGFSIKDSRFKVRLEGLDCEVKVGDKFSVLEPLKPIHMDWFDKNWYCLYFYDEMVSFEVINGVIQCIDFSGSI